MPWVDNDGAAARLAMQVLLARASPEVDNSRMQLFACVASRPAGRWPLPPYPAPRHHAPSAPRDEQLRARGGRGQRVSMEQAIGLVDSGWSEGSHLTGLPGKCGPRNRAVAAERIDSNAAGRRQLGRCVAAATQTSHRSW